MRKNRRLCFVLACVFLFGCSTPTPIEPPPAPVPPKDDEELIQTVDINLYAGKAFWEETDGAEGYRIYANNFELGYTSGLNYDVVEKISDNFELLYGDWNIKVDAIQQDKIIATVSEQMRIRPLNQDNFTTILNGDYNISDYFMLEDDIYYFGGYGQNLVSDTPDGYVYREVLYCGEGIMCFIKKPFSATLDGNGHTINLLVDRPLNIDMAVGALFISLTETGLLKNVVINGDYMRAKFSQYTALAVYKDCTGRIENCWFDFTLRPTDTENRYKFDPKAALIGCTKDGFYAKNVVFLLKVLDDNGQEILLATNNQKTGGAICRSEGTSVYENCVFIQRGGTGRFINDNTAHAKAGLGSSVANSVFYYPAIDNFISGENGFIFTGDFKEAGGDLTFSEPALNKAYLGWDKVWIIDENSICLKGAELYID